ncbi:dehydrogenase/reductase SDR family member 12 isoform X1 [Cynocephalus volans]|uniref:dehydrogenase/reductase SDR family member 12 isoform X1 n=1 Tax=Cynocephalus volans TaxID=110931 RepID=UPI002FC7EED1
MFLYRNAAWFAKGLREYTKSGYESASKDFVPDDLEVQVPGRAFLVTGGNSGIGKATAIEIAKRGGTVHLACRDPERAAGAKGEIIRESGNQNIFLHIVDLSEPKKIWKFVENFKQEHKLHVLINNAGCMVNERELTEDGLEKNFATNTLVWASLPLHTRGFEAAFFQSRGEENTRLKKKQPSKPQRHVARPHLWLWESRAREGGCTSGVYILTTALIPVLEKEHDPRVITVSSGGMLVQKLNTSDLQSERAAFNGTMVYAQNKRQQVVLTERWAQMHPAIHFSSVHPGWVDTPAVRLSMPGFHARLGDRLRSAAQGADTVLWLAVSPAAAAHPSGLFFQDRKPVSRHLPLARTSSSPAEEEKLIEILEQLAQRFK